MGADGILVEWLRWVLLIASGSLDRPGGMRFPRGALQPPAPAAAARAPVTVPGPPSRPELPRVANQIPAVALADEIEAGNVRVAVRHRRQPDRGAARTRPRACGAAQARRARRRRRDGERAHRARDPRAPGHRCSSSAPTSPCTRTSRCARRCSRPRPSSPPVAERRPVWWVLGNVARAGRRRPARRRRSRHAHRRAVPPRDPRALAARRRHRVRRRPPRLRPRRSSTAGCTSRCCPTAAGSSPPQCCSSGWRRTANPAPGCVLSPGREPWRGATRCGTAPDDDLARLRAPPRRRHRRRRRRRRRAVGASASTARSTCTIVVDDRMRAGVVSLVHGRRGHSPGPPRQRTRRRRPADHDATHLGVPVRVEATAS